MSTTKLDPNRSVKALTTVTSIWTNIFGVLQLRDLLYWMEDILTTQNTDSSEVPSTSSPSPARVNDFDENEWLVKCHR